MSQTTHYPESMSGPRERIIPLDCSTCYVVRSQTECDNCLEPLCDECAVRCDGCAKDKPYCLRCAITRVAFVKVDGKWYCENCAPDTGSEECSDRSYGEEA